MESRRSWGDAPSTVSRELRRNRDPDGRYRPHHAEHAARLRACKLRQRRVAIDRLLAEVAQRLLGKRWSPEQVAHELRRRFAGSAIGGCLWSRSTKRSMTRRLR